jgi:multicomponent Na+:H+ antiporter subunit D
LIAIFQSDVKRLLAYSSLAQIGYMTLGVSLQTQAGLIASMINLFNHAFIKGALFMCLACLAYSIKTTRCEHMAGIGKTQPWVAAAFVIGGIALIGLPPTAGFISKWYIVLAVLENSWWLAIVVVLTSLLAVVYVWRVIEQMYLREPLDNIQHDTPVPTMLLSCTWVMILLSVYFGIDNRFPVRMATMAAEVLMP